MIKPLQSHRVYALGGKTPVGKAPPSQDEIVDKINEIIDWINRQEERQTTKWREQNG